MGETASRLTSVRKIPDLPVRVADDFVIPKRYEPSEERRASEAIKFPLGSIDAAIYQTSLDFDNKRVAEPTPLGSLTFEVRYEECEEHLVVHVINGKRLPVRHVIKKEGQMLKFQPISCQSLLTVCLLPEEKPVLESYVVSETRDPDFNECFVFKLVGAEMSDKTVRISLFDAKRRHKLIPVGHVLFSLKGRELGMTEEREIKQQSQPYGHTRGYILISLRLLPALAKIAVGIIEARHLFHYENQAKREYFVKVTHIQGDHKIKTRRTPICEGERNVMFKHKLTFPINLSQLSDTALVISLMDHGIVRNDKLVGRVVLGPFLFASENEQSHWGRMVTKPLKQSEQWHPLLV